MSGLKITLPAPCAFILSRLHENGFEAYAVGGCVRDSLLHKTPHDWDITTAAIESISVSEDATLFSLSDSPADISFIAGIFEKIAEAGIDVDMISQFLPNSSHAGLSFTVSDDDFGGVLEIATQLRAENKKIKISVSSGNCKISVSGAEMEGRPGVAARVFKAAANAGCDIRMINTSETEISLLVVKADVDATVAAIKKEFE